MSDDLKILFPGRDVEIRDASSASGVQTVRVNPFYARQFPKVLSMIQELGPILKAANAASQDDDGALGGFMLKAIELGGEKIFEIAAMAIGKPVTIFDTMHMDDCLTVIAAVIEENRDFFIQRVGPQIVKLSGSILPPAALEALDTEKSTAGSSPQDTPAM